MEKDRLRELENKANSLEPTQVGAVYENKDVTLDYTTFYNQEIKSISEYEGTTEEIFSRIQQDIKDYGEQIRSIHARQNAAINYIQQNTHKLSQEAQEKFKLKDLTYKVLPPKAPRSTTVKKVVKLAETDEEKDIVYSKIAKSLGWFDDNHQPDIKRAKEMIEEGTK